MADLEDANMIEADLYESYMQGAQLINTRLRGAILKNTNFDGTIMFSVDLRVAKHLNEDQLRTIVTDNENILSSNLKEIKKKAQ